MSQRIPIQTPAGILRGRDCIFLDRVAFENTTNILILEGSINPLRAEIRVPAVHGKIEIADQEIPTIQGPRFRLTFRGVMAMRLVELDSGDWNWNASFEEIVDSEWVQSLGGKVTSNHRHFFVQTYDDLFDVVCKSYLLEFVDPDPHAVVSPTPIAVPSEP